MGEGKYLEEGPRLKIDNVGVYLTLVDRDDVLEKLKELENIKDSVASKQDLDRELERLGLHFKEGRTIMDYREQGTEPAAHPDLIRAMENGASQHVLVMEDGTEVGTLFLSRSR